MTQDSRSHTSHFYIKVDGSHLAPAIMTRVSEVVVEQSNQLPAVFSIRLYDYGDETTPDRASFFQILNGSTFSIGKEVEILMGREAEPSAITKGEITAIEIDASSERGPLLTLRGYDKGHRLHRGRYTRSFLNSKDSDVAQKMAGEASLEVQADDTAVPHDYLFQNNQTNWEFLKDRAARIGYEVFVGDGKLNFRKPPSSASAVTLKLWDDLLHLRVKATSSYQPASVTVKGWDQKQKAAITGEASSGQLAPGVQIASDRKSKATTFGQSKVFLVNRIMDSQDEASKVATGIYELLDAAFIHAEGVCFGKPEIKPGVKVKVENVGSQLNGEYYVTSATHTYTAREGYITSFAVSGLQTNTLLEMLKTRSDATGLIPNVVVGIVTNNKDDQNLGRVKVKFPWMPQSDSGNDQESTWARIAAPMAGKERGFYYLPEVDDEVLVAFEHGDPTRPYVLGGLWNGKDTPIEGNDQAVGSDGKVNHRIIKTRQGHQIMLDDTDGKEKIAITTKSGHAFTMDDKSGSEVISIIDKTGKNLIKIESSSNKITILADKDICVEAKQGKVDVKAQGEVNVDTKSRAAVTAAQDVSVSTKANAKVEATGNADVTAKGNISVEATGSLSLKGMSVTVEGKTSVEVKNIAASVKLSGPTVNINNGALEVM